MLKNSEVVLFLTPYKVCQAGNFWTLLRRVESTYGMILTEENGRIRWKKMFSATMSTTNLIWTTLEVKLGLQIE